VRVGAVGYDIVVARRADPPCSRERPPPRLRVSAAVSRRSAEPRRVRTNPNSARSRAWCTARISIAFRLRGPRRRHARLDLAGAPCLSARHPAAHPLARPRCCHPLRRGLDAAAASVCFVAWSLACATHHKCVSALASALLASISLRWHRERRRSRRRCVATPPALPSSPLRSHTSATRRTREPIHVVKRARSTHRLCPCHRATRPACAGSRAIHLAAHAATARTTRAGETPPAAPKCVPAASSGQARVAFDPPLPFGLCSGAERSDEHCARSRSLAG
jgi:hypothetical protein